MNDDRSLVLFVERVEIRIFEHSESSFFVLSGQVWNLRIFVVRCRRFV